MMEEVRKLREETGAGVMECKRALEEAGGELRRAVEVIRERGYAKAEKKADRVAGSGLIVAYVHNDRIGALVELRCETDFVAHTDAFRELAKNVAMQVAATGVETVEELLAAAYIKDPARTVADLVTEAVARMGENTIVRRFVRYAL